MEVNVKNSNNIISRVYPGSIAEELDIEIGDILISVNGEKVKDIIQYRFLTDDDYIELEIETKNGERVVYEIEKEFDEELGIEFTNPIIDKAKSCRNKCMFCFIDQLPKGMRETLYFKDDDSRLSFLQGNFITLTNMSEQDINDIIRYRISPINISVHTTNPELRQKMITNRFAGKVYGIMERLADAGITMNCQIVLCPGVNDGKELERTINDLSALYPNVNSVAIVPVGITKHREHLPHLEIFNKDTANEAIDLVEGLQKKCFDKFGSRFAFMSDELYIIAERELPDYDSYEGFLQFEDGVGMIRKLGEEIKYELKNIPEEFDVREKTVSIATGSSAYEFICEMAELVMSRFPQIKINVYKIRNEFWGETITVSGLITAQDLIKQLSDVEKGETLYITRSMMKADEEIFLDDVTLEELEKILGVEVVASENNGKDFVEKILK
ncbi:DUF512 domain-containing protein [Peptacetobacter hominis]|uniref:DUF512 domain-containing protein n=1 Tax=Peptacetobacter hominis TaxID=2743610 RepID=A0A544QUU9_9FIRM|nr:DUF512 domain-containing protein [Peptacetobacter hominis]TQQ84456.1 DUF512 domain-containing protein [Peptacetobacter hominis]